MNNLKSKSLKIVLFTFICLVVFQANAQFVIHKYSINNGGGHAIGGVFEVKNSIGQHDSSLVMSGGEFTVNGGFWKPNTDLIFRDSFRNREVE